MRNTIQLVAVITQKLLARVESRSISEVCVPIIIYTRRGSWVISFHFISSSMYYLVISDCRKVKCEFGIFTYGVKYVRNLMK
jgi:hypothetical protein